MSSSVAGELSSGTPLIHFSFPFVSRWVMVSQHGSPGTAPIKMGFTQNGVSGPTTGDYTLTGSNANYLTVFEGGNWFGPYEVKCSGVYFRDGGYGAGATIHLVAGLTTVPSDPLRQLLTGSNEFEGIG